MTTTVVNNSLFRTFFEKQKLTGINFIEWYRNLRIMLYVEDKLTFLEQPIPAMPVPPVGQVLPLDVLHTHTAWVKASKEIIGSNAYDQGSIRKEYDGFVQNYNMHNMGKTVNELHDMLKLHKQTLLPKEAAPALHAIRAGRIQKNQKKKSHKAAKGNQRKGKAKMGYAPMPAPPFAPKPKNPPTPKKDNPTKDAICHQCGEVVHLWVFDSVVVLISVYTQGLRGSRKLKPGALSMYVGDGHRATVEANGEFYLCLPSGLTNDSSMYAVSNKRVKLMIGLYSFVALSCTMPNAHDVDDHDTAIYIPLYHRTGGFTGNERDIYKSLVYCLFHEGRVVLPDFLEDELNLRPTFGAIGFTIDNVETILTLENFAQILRIPCEGVCLYSHEWSISSLQRSLDPHPNLYPYPIEDPSLVRDALFKERPELIL
ncbi:hypothetical protein Tco_0397209 [Tanacetum coccineum]